MSRKARVLSLSNSLKDGISPVKALAAAVLVVWMLYPG